MKKPYFGWWIVVVGFFLMMFLFAPVMNLSGFYVIPLSENFSILRSTAILATTFSTVTSMLVSLFAGRLLSRFNIRKMVTLFLVLSALGCTLCAMAPSFGFVIAGSIIRGLCYPFVTTLPLSILVGNWFGKAILGRAWAITTMGTGIGLLVLSPATAAIMGQWGWRGGYAFYALLALVMIPFVLLTFYTCPDDKGLAQLGGNDESKTEKTGSGIAFRDALRSPVLWLYLVSILLLGGSGHNWNLNGAAYFSDIGFSLAHVSLLLSIAAVGITVSKFALGAICDKFSIKAGVVTTTLAVMAGVTIFIVAYSVPVLAYPGAIVVGFGVTVATVMPVLVARDLFGDRDFGTIAGFMQSSSMLGSALVPLVAAAGYDWLGNYIPAWGGSFILCLLALLGILTAYRLQPALAARHWNSGATKL
ncbi:MAG: MFS transporter [Coriobacteriia bacterium]|nr:MFS transporter [Coriobacteriia bacterium]